MQTKLTFSTSELEKLKHVREKILKDITAHYTIDQLAIVAGMNTYKLKMGFKMAFGQTIFKCLEHARLERGMELIEDGQHDIATIASIVGYKFSTNFIVAFKRNFGITPLDYKPPIEHFKDKALQAARIIESRLDKHHTVETLSLELNVSGRRLLASFKKEFSESPYSYLQKKRMEKAKELMLKGISSKEIITHFGYHDVRNLDSAFKTAYGKTTAQWRAENWSVTGSSHPSGTP